MRSASSSTSTCTWLRSTILRSMRSMRRPGVATRRSQPRARSAIWRSKRAPPITITERWPVCWQTTVVTFSICCASSRVGVTTSASGAVGTSGALMGVGASGAALPLRRRRLRRLGCSAGASSASSPAVSSDSAATGASCASVGARPAMRCSVGSAKAAVFPVPVCADATMSLP